jgi:branched-chain amino acid transport system ATP-binding protein
MSSAPCSALLFSTPGPKRSQDLAQGGSSSTQLIQMNLAVRRVYIINNGHIVHEGPAQELKARPELLQRYLGV